MSFSKLRPSGSMVVAIVALIAAIGGTSYAASKITGDDVKNRSLTGKDVADNSLGSRQIRGSVRTRWFLLNEAGVIEEQSGGFTVIDAYVTNANAYVDAGQSLVGKGFSATIAIQNQVNVDGMDGDPEPNFAGEVSVTRCQITGVVACAPPGAQNQNALVVSPRNSDGSATVAGARKRVYVTVTE